MIELIVRAIHTRRRPRGHWQQIVVSPVRLASPVVGIGDVEQDPGGGVSCTRTAP
jgi:hypothetical protein